MALGRNVSTVNDIMSVKVSIVIAVYNVAQYIEQCARSLFGQTLADLEYIFVDDHSSDGSMDIVGRLLEEYPDRKGQVRTIIHEENQGVAATKNEGIQGATGEYVIIVDPDDYVELDMMERMYEKAVQENADMVICDYYRFYGEESHWETAVPNGVVGDGKNVRDDIINRRNPPFCVVRLFKRTLFYREGVVWPVGRFAEDIVYSIVTAYYAAKIAHVKEPLYHYRTHSSSLTHSVSEEACLANYAGNRDNVNIMTGFLESVGAAEEYWKGILIQKLRVRNRLLPIINRWHYRRLWFKVYPEINRVLFWGDKRYRSSYREKVWFLCIALGLYPMFKKYLGGKHLRPFPEWPVW